ncbi:MAG TPA: TetR/AcrR family transcriptional regulator [Jatrophihabitans sp.]|jgi:AcrR family transcriptional regulator
MVPTDEDEDDATVQRRPVGRPRRLVLGQIVAAADRLGPDNFTMTGVAEELGVSVGTLYQYVADRDELLNLVVAHRLAGLPIPPDDGQPWSEYLRDYVDGLTATLIQDMPTTIHVFTVESMLELELRLAEPFYAALVTRGFDLQEAVSIFTQATVIAIGTAMGVEHDRLSAGEAGSLPAAIDQVLDALPPDDLPYVREAVPAYALRTHGVHNELVAALIARISAKKRGNPAR